MKSKKFYLVLFLLVAFAATAILTSCKRGTAVTTPEEQFGHMIGADYILITYTQMVEYWKKLAEESDRMILVDIGKTVEGRTMWMAIITSPKNHRKLDRYKEISRRLALAEGLTDSEAQALAEEGKAVVWIDGGTHADEIVNSQTELELVYQMVSKNDRETLRFLDDVILLTLVTNPDGMDIVGNWYMGDPKNRNTSRLPELFHKYIGGDTNRDHYMSNQPETENINRVLYREWFPQIVFNQHQTGPDGAVLFVPPFRDPFNYDYDPLVVMGIDQVSAAMHSRMIAENKPGSAMRRMANYSTWWEGCLRCGTYFHNSIGILTEINGNPTPMEITFLPEKHLAKNDYPYPIAPQKWHFRQAIEYIMTANLAILDVASRMKDTFQYNRYLMGKNSIEKGSKDYVTITPKRIAAVMAAIKKDKAKTTRRGIQGDLGYPPEYYDDVLHDRAARDARGYIIPSDQADFLTATKFVNVLIKSGIFIDRATRSFTVEGKTYPAGSYVIKTAQAFRPHIRSMFEPQNHPDDFLYPGGPPIPPYDSAGWTLAYTMGVEFDSIFDGFDGPFERIEGFAEPPAGEVTKADGTGFLLSHKVNDAFIAINKLLGSGEEVYWLKDPVQAEGKSFPSGTIYIPAKSSTVAKLQEMASEIGLNFEGIDSKPRGKALRLKPVRIGLWDEYGGSRTSGWTRWLLEQFEFPFEVVYPQALDAGSLVSKFDVLIFETGAISPQLDRAGNVERRAEQPDPQSIPAKYRDRLGFISVDKTIPQLRRFLQNGGTILAIGSSTSLAYHLRLPVANALLDKRTRKALPMEKYWAPGSVHQVLVDNSNPLAYGMPEKLDVYFNKNPVFQTQPGAAQKGVRSVAWFGLDVRISIP